LIISRKLENKVQNRLQIIAGQIELGHSKKALQSIHDLSRLIGRYVESAEEETARAQREEDDL
jgi:hypothetical protein